MSEQALRQAARRLLEEGAVQVVIGYGQSHADLAAHPIFVLKAEDTDELVWNNRCYANLAAQLKRREVKALGKPAVVVKACDARALTVLLQESQIVRENIHIIGMACDGMGDPLLYKCRTCPSHTPDIADEVLGQAHMPDSTEKPYAALDAFYAAHPTPEARLAFWSAEFDRCIKCYACRQVCPMCYCECCIVDKNRPQSLDTSATLKGNFAWQIVRAFHQAGRCVSCGECERSCPAGIELGLLNASAARAAEEAFEGYRAGMDSETPPVIGSYSKADKEEFIR